MSGRYDSEMKELIIKAAKPLLKMQLNLDISLENPLNRTFPTGQEKEVDFLYEINQKGQDEPAILHIELQSTNDSNMLARMLNYAVLIYEKYKVYPLQICIYHGKDKCSMKNEIRNENLGFTYRYHLLSLHSTHYKELLETGQPELIIYSIMCDFKGTPQEQVIEEIVSSLKSAVKGTESLKKSFKRLELFALIKSDDDNLLQQLVIQKTKEMPLEIDITKDARYKEGQRIGEERGEKRGEIRGKLEGERIGRRRTIEKHVEKLLKHNFTVEQVAEVLGLEKDLVEKIKDKRRL